MAILVNKLQQQRTRWVNAQVERFGVTHKQAQTYYALHDPLNHNVLRMLIERHPELEAFIVENMN